MNEWIIVGIITLVVSEILFYKYGNECVWVPQKIFFLFIGLFSSMFLWFLPYGYAFNCGFMYGEGVSCTNYGIEFFYWYYGVIILIIAFFFLNYKLIKWKSKNSIKMKDKKI